ncbi:GGDEF domain-containing protein [Neobacillus notoginsengisoli]|uniref:GGDEF domain-containing protein n=1 Tax=Neobacillus notoginsengisoli TaxID=1578198 RepID=A0A417YTB0_9BACI|nr:GGDEF domain-containing protein [Neobacillus notoginsengisoli]RHW40305.1 GGDEF domain-containing protein [Neobacillus notoginsengisoli]
MVGARFFNFILFFAGLAVAFNVKTIPLNADHYVKVLVLFWLFSTMYHHLRVLHKTGNTTVDYGISYSLSFGIFAGPLGLFIFETIYRFTVYFNKKRTGTDDPEEFSDTFYNIGAFVLTYSAAYYLYNLLRPVFELFPFGYWILIFLLVCITSLLIDLLLIIVFLLTSDIKTVREAVDFIKSRSILDMGKTAFTNGLLLLFLREGEWGALFALFFLNYLVSRSFYSKSQSIKNKIERDKFEQMAYTDFLTGANNRAFMDKRMAELDETGEYIGIVVADIDNFKHINDTYNHSVGDQVIRHFAKTLKSYINGNDNLFRSGGEEFTLFLRNRNYRQCLDLVERIRRGIEESAVEAEYGPGTASISYTSSFGLYFYRIHHKVSMEKGYIQADQLLLTSKQHGRNRITALDGSNKQGNMPVSIPKQKLVP